MNTFLLIVLIAGLLFAICFMIYERSCSHVYEKDIEKSKVNYRDNFYKCNKCGLTKHTHFGGSIT